MPPPVTLEELQKMHIMVAAMVCEDAVYLPVFQRIEQEIVQLRKQTNAIDRARAVVALHRAAA